MRGALNRNRGSVLLCRVAGIYTAQVLLEAGIKVWFGFRFLLLFITKVELKNANLSISMPAHWSGSELQTWRLWLAHQLVLLALLEDLSLYFTVAPAYVTCCSYES